MAIALGLGLAVALSATVLDGGGGLQWALPGPDAQGRYALGQPLLRTKPIDTQPVLDGIAFWRRASDFLVVPVFASTLVLDADGAGATLSGAAQLPTGGPGGAGADTQVTLRLSLDAASPAAALLVAFSSASGIAPGVWQLCVKWAHDGPTTDEWRAQGYPLASNASSLPSTTTLHYSGWPGLLFYRPNASVVTYFGLAASEDYDNPTTWTGSTMVGFQSVGGFQIAPQYLLGAAGLKPGQVCECTLRLVASDVGETLAAVRDVIVPALIRLDGYAVEPMPPLRAPQDVLACFVNARRGTPMWRSTPAGEAYQLQDIASFIYLGTTPESAYLEYRLFMATGDQLWRNRSMLQMSFWLGGQNLNASSRHVGAVHTAYNLPSGPYNSDDRGGNRGWKPDINAHMSRYALLLWELVKSHEGLDMAPWFTAAQLSARWVLRMASTQAAAGGLPGSGGLPQKIAAETDLPSASATSGRYMNALPVWARLLGDTPTYNFSALQAEAEAWTVAHVEGELFFFGQHPDIADREQDSIWEIVEYWLDRHDSSGDPRALERAVGDASVAFLMLVPRQLSWVTHPTQMAADEQPQYNQLSVYTYHNRKWLALQRLGKATGAPLWSQLADRLMQLNAFLQVTAGASDDIGGIHECIADPWGDRGGGVDYTGSVYLNELALDLALQILVSGVSPNATYEGCAVPTSV